LKVLKYTLQNHRFGYAGLHCEISILIFEMYHLYVWNFSPKNQARRLGAVLPHTTA